MTIVYDGDGNRVAKTVGGATTAYLVDTKNPTGYAQVVEELRGGVLWRKYSYGLGRISETQTINGKVTSSFYGYDGHGSVRLLTDSAGNVTDTYDYDAFGNLINSTGSTPNNILFAGEEFDPDLGLYFNRARYLDTRAGRFWGMDTWEGSGRDPGSLHKYTYVGGNPVDHLDPSGNFTIAEATEVEGIMEDLSATLNSIMRVQQTIERVESTVDLVVELWQVINTIATGGVSSLMGEVPKFDLPANALEMVFDSLAQNGPKALALAATQPIMLEKILLAFKDQRSAFILYMPLPSPKLLLNTPLKVRGKPIKLYFGGSKSWKGRVLGLGMLKDKTNFSTDLQVFRMDYHEFHFGSSSSTTDDLVQPWSDGVFHYHIPRPNKF